MTQSLEFLTGLMEEYLWLAPFLCLLAGVITSFTPCSLSTIPSVIAYVGAAAENRSRKAFGLSVTMALGMAVTFGIFGSVASAVGHMFHDAGEWWTFFLGVLMILMALQIWEVIHILPHVHVEEQDSRKGYGGAFLIGMLNGLFASHCATPVMIALLALVAGTGKGLWWGIFLMICYALGHSLLLVAAGTGYGVVEKMMYHPRYASFGSKLRILMGGVIFLIGILMIV